LYLSFFPEKYCFHRKKKVCLPEEGDRERDRERETIRPFSFERERERKKDGNLPFFFFFSFFCLFFHALESKKTLAFSFLPF